MAEQYRVSGRTAEEIARSVEQGVALGSLVAGQALVPVRALALELGVSPATVAKAYQELRRRGVVTTAGRAGTRIRSRPAVRSRRSRALVPADGARDLASGSPDPALLPALGPALTRVAAGLGGASGYTPGMLPELERAAAARLAADGVPVDSLTATGGALDGIERLLSAHLRPGDTVAVEDPGWAALLDLVAALGLEPVPVPVDDGGPTPAGLRAALDRGARAVVLTARAHNPTGAAIGRERARGLRAELAGRDVLLVEDDHAAELSPLPLHTLAGATTSWAFVRSVSKPYGPDLRLAVVAGDPATVARVAGRMALGAGWVSTLLQRLVLELWQDDDVAATVATAREEYARRRSALVAALAARGVRAHGRTGINVWVPGVDETRVVAELRPRWAVAPGSQFRLVSGPGVRITVAGLVDADVEPLAEALAHAVLGPGRPTV
ncbi:aminotransferase class I/II-fold pyridoxal phosphate-dependent enzyme [Cellulomonas sp. APG4]|uniref:aminotransferase class I/II-fold pyridoxal phosphate-dependent enzyme n=1 Tax=Cellulomonas sp. APG4 TaxID=1538656 RepID=UPI001379D3DB|nr:aminotransferase class I/II-fold pyridoxal phosphate-dependent enzyme [Cellulomonas sp. APG4]